MNDLCILVFSKEANGVYLHTTTISGNQPWPWKMLKGTLQRGSYLLITGGDEAVLVKGTLDK